MTRLRIAWIPVSTMAGIVVFAMAGFSLLARPSTAQEYAPVSVKADANTSSPAIMTAVTEAMVTHQQVYSSSIQVLRGSPVLRQASAATRLQLAPGSSTLAVLTTEETQQLRQLKESQINSRFKDTAAVKENGAIAAVEEANKDPNFRSLDGGVSGVTVRSERVIGSHADVQATVAAWSSMAQRQPNGSWVTATPQNMLEIRMSLDVDANGGWVVTALAWNFAPGSQP
jgi:hypothetical protein